MTPTQVTDQSLERESFRNKFLKEAQFSTTIRSNGRDMNQIVKRLVTAILSIVISGLKLVVNMFTIGISFVMNKDIPMVEDWISQSKDWNSKKTFKDKVVKEYKAIEIEKTYVVEHSEYNTQVDWGEYNPKIKDIQTHKNIIRDLLD